METLLTVLFITIIIALVVFIIVSIYFIAYITKNIVIEDSPTIFYIKDLDGDNIINIEEIEQINQRYNTNTNEYELIYYLKSGHELKETFNVSAACQERFDDIYRILNDLDY